MNDASKPDLAIDERLRNTLGEVDHRTVAAPYLRLINSIQGTHGDRVWLWDVRFTQPNTDHIPSAAVHSLEHMIAVFVQKHLPGFINFGCMGCQTGFYLSAMNYGDYDGMLDVLQKTLEDCLQAKEVPLANIEQCGWAANHTLEGAQKFARMMLDNRAKWTKVYR